MSLPVAAEIVDWGSLLEIVVVSLVAGVGLTAVFSIAVLGAVRSVDSARDGRRITAGAFGAITLVALAACLAAIVYGVAIMVAK
jgi:hypothetical protein